MSDQLSQRIVYAGLRRMTDDRSVIKSAYNYWLSQLSNNEFDVLSVVTNLVEFLGLSSQEKKALMIALHAASNKLIDELPPVPGVMSEGVNDSGLSDEPSTQAGTTEKTSPHQQITQRYIQLFSQYIRRASPSDYTDVRQAIASEGLDGVDRSVSKVISGWASDGMANLKLPYNITEGMCKTLALEFYMFASEFIGPNQCDEIVIKAINDCLDMDAAARFNPRDLV